MSVPAKREDTAGDLASKVKVLGRGRGRGFGTLSTEPLLTGGGRRMHRAGEGDEASLQRSARLSHHPPLDPAETQKIWEAVSPAGLTTRKGSWRPIRAAEEKKEISIKISGSQDRKLASRYAETSPDNPQPGGDNLLRASLCPTAGASCGLGTTSGFTIPTRRHITCRKSYHCKLRSLGNPLIITCET